MKQIQKANSKIRELLKFTALQYILDTLCENPKLGKTFVDDADNTNVCIICFHHLVFFGGNLTQDCLGFLTKDILPEYIRNNQHVLYMLYPNEAWKNALKGLLPGNCSEYERSLYRHKLECVDKLPICADNVSEITSKLMNSTINNLDMIINEVIPTGTYNSMEDYLMRGIGYSPIINHKVCGFCTSEYPSKSAIAIGIEVLEEYQRKGYAKAMTKAFLYKARQRGLDIYWECLKNNIASVNTALSCGFEIVADYSILFVEL